MSRLLTQIVGLGLILLGIYILGNNIFFVTDAYPWWRGIAADVSILLLTAGVVGLVYFPNDLKAAAWIAIGIGIIFVFFSGRAILRPTSLWEFFLSAGSMVIGYRLLQGKRLNF